jgi:hypothetical protein
MRPHYYKAPNGLTPFDIIDAYGLDFYEGNAIKYLIRWRRKNGIEDLRKAITYIEEEIKRADRDSLYRYGPGGSEEKLLPTTEPPHRQPGEKEHEHACGALCLGEQPCNSAYESDGRAIRMARQQTQEDVARIHGLDVAKMAGLGNVVRMPVGRCAQCGIAGDEQALYGWDERRYICRDTHGCADRQREHDTEPQCCAECGPQPPLPGTVPDGEIHPNPINEPPSSRNVDAIVSPYRICARPGCGHPREAHRGTPTLACTMVCKCPVFCAEWRLTEEEAAAAAWPAGDARPAWEPVKPGVTKVCIACSEEMGKPHRSWCPVLTGRLSTMPRAGERIPKDGEHDPDDPAHGD